MLGFRVWDSDSKDMFYACADGDSYYVDMEGRAWGQWDGELYSPTDPKGLIPMQSTGIKDCCNNMIFEGDILLEGHNYILVNNIIDFLMYLGTFDDVFEKGKLIMPIIGNIYSDPELLEKLK